MDCAEPNMGHVVHFHIVASSVIEDDIKLCVCHLHTEDAIEQEEGTADENDVPDGFN